MRRIVSSEPFKTEQKKVPIGSYRICIRSVPADSETENVPEDHKRG